MELRIKKDDIRLDVCMMQIICVISIMIHLLNTVGLVTVSVIYHTNFALWLVFGVCNFKNSKCLVEHDICILAMFLLGVEMLSVVNGLINEAFAYSDLAYIFLTPICVVLTLGIDFNVSYKRKDVIKIYRTIVVLSVVAVVYALCFQNQYMGSRDLLHQWLFRSFFITRNNFACMCMMGCIASFFLWRVEKKNIYLILQGVMCINIWFANSRNAILSLLVFYVFFLVRLVRKNRVWLLVLLFASVIGMGYVYEGNIISEIVERFSHPIANTSTDSANVRLAIWKDIIDKVLREGNILIGYGSEYVSNYLTEKYSVGSAHNVYIGLLMKGGLFKLSMYLFLQLKIWLNIQKLSSKEYRYFNMGFFLCVTAYSLFDSYVEMFSNCYYSLIVTLLLAFIPRYTRKVEMEKDYEKKSKCCYERI